MVIAASSCIGQTLRKTAKTMFRGSPSLIRLCVHCRRSLVWWLGLGFFSAVLALLYLNGSKSLAALPDKINATYDFVIGKRVHWN